jgi:YggT family protein
MFIIDSLVWLVNTIFFILYIVLVIRIIISWVSADPYNEIVQVIYSISEPILAPFRRLPLQLGAIDFSPLLAFFVLRILNSFVIWILYSLRVFIARGF